MAIAAQPQVFQELVELLAENADSDRVLAFRLPEERQKKLDQLVKKQRAGTLTDDEASELAAFEQFEHLVRMLKARYRAAS